MKSAASGLGSGLIGVVIFSGSLPATRLAVADFSPLFLTSARAAIAALLAVLLLCRWRQPLPRRREWRALAVVAAGVVIGFPLLTALALQTISASRSLVFIGLLPLATAIFGVWRGGERPGAGFWLFSLAGAGCVVLFALRQGEPGSGWGDVLMLLSIVCCGAGYAEGAVLTRRLGGWQVISWALLLAALPMGVLAVLTLPPSLAAISLSGWLSLGYVSVFSMLVGFIFWYRGLAAGGIATVGQLQLLQPFFGLTLAALILHETLGWPALATALAVVICVALARRSARPLPPPVRHRV